MQTNMNITKHSFYFYKFRLLNYRTKNRSDTAGTIVDSSWLVPRHETAHRYETANIKNPAL